MNQSSKSAAFKFTMNLKPIQIILPISILSFLFSQTPVFDGLLNLLETCGFDSTYTLSIRTYAFILFNGLIVMLIKNSGTSKEVPDSSNSSLKTAPETTVFDVEEEDDHEVLAGNHEENDKDDGSYDTSDILADEEEEEEEHEDSILADHDEEDEDDVLADEEEDGQDSILAIDEDDFLADDHEEAEEVIEWGISVEELNSKCDDFIKNMRHML